MYFIRVFYQNKDMALIYLPGLRHMNAAFSAEVLDFTIRLNDLVSPITYKLLSETCELNILEETF